MFQHHPAQDPRAGEIPGLESRDDAGRRLQPVVRCLFCCPLCHALRNPPAGTGSLPPGRLQWGSPCLWAAPWSVSIREPPAIICGWLPSASPDCLTQPRPPPMASRSRVRKTVPCYGPQINPFYLAIPGEKEKPVAESVCLSVPWKGNRSKYVNYRHEVLWETTCRH